MSASGDEVDKKSAGDVEDVSAGGKVSASGDEVDEKSADDVEDVSAGGKVSASGDEVDKKSADDVEDVGAGGKVSASEDEVVSDRGIKAEVQDEVVGGDSGEGVEIQVAKGESVSVGDVKGGDVVRKAGDSESYESSYIHTKSKNKRRNCPFGVHLNRHLMSAHGDKVTSKEHQMRLVYRADFKDKKQRGEKSTASNDHEHIYQCGIPGCHKIVSRMSQHLKRCHKIADPARLIAALKKFTRLSGQRTRRPSTNPKGPKPKPALKAKKASESRKTLKQSADESSDIVPPTPKRGQRVEED